MKTNQKWENDKVKVKNPHFIKWLEENGYNDIEDLFPCLQVEINEFGEIWYKTEGMGDWEQADDNGYFALTMDNGIDGIEIIAKLNI